MTNHRSLRPAPAPMTNVSFHLAAFLAWLAISTVGAAQAPVTPLCLDTGGTKGGDVSAGYTIRLGDRVIAVTSHILETKVFQNGNKTSYAWSRPGQHEQWKLDTDRLLRPVNITYCPIIANESPVPVCSYSPSFALADGETLLVHAPDGKRIQGTFRCYDYNTAGYNTEQGFRALFIELPGNVDIHSFGAYKTVTKLDGKQVVGTVFSTTTRKHPKTNDDINALQFEPLLIAHPSFQAPPPPKDGNVFGRPSTIAAARGLAQWISTDFFPLKVGASAQALRSAYRVGPDQDFFSINGELRSQYNNATITIQKDKLTEVSFANRTLMATEPPQIDYLSSLLAVFGEPTEAIKVVDAYKVEAVFLRFRLSQEADFVAQLTKKGPVGASIDKPQALANLAIRSRAVTTTPLPTRSQDLAAACNILWK
jgi:hypothetical protein